MKVIDSVGRFFVKLDEKVLEKIQGGVCRFLKATFSEYGNCICASVASVASADRPGYQAQQQAQPTPR